MLTVPKAFILGAGLGTRLRPLTESLPKPLVPVWNRPLISFGLDHLISELEVKEFMINTHHCAEAYDIAFPKGGYSGTNLSFRHEPTLLDTAGGIDNIRDWLPTDVSSVIYNGDILTDLPLRSAWETHCDSDNLVTLLLRSEGDELRVGFDEGTGEVVDLRGQLRPDWEGRYQFTGIYFISPRFLDFIRPGKIESVVLCFLEAIRQGEKVGGILVDEGLWTDLGERESYLDALKMPHEGFPRYAVDGGLERIANTARIANGVEIDDLSAICSEVTIGEGAKIVESILWDGCEVAPNSRLKRTVVMGGLLAGGELENVDLQI